MTRIRSGGMGMGRRRKSVSRGKRAICEITNPKTGRFMGYWNGLEEQLLAGCCPCPGGQSCLPGCCDLHDF